MWITIDPVTLMFVVGVGQFGVGLYLKFWRWRIGWVVSSIFLGPLYLTWGGVYRPRNGGHWAIGHRQEKE